jgi:hypothetical protein
MSNEWTTHHVWLILYTKPISGIYIHSKYTIFLLQNVVRFLITYSVKPILKWITIFYHYSHFDSGIFTGRSDQILGQFSFIVPTLFDHGILEIFFLTVHLFCYFSVLKSVSHSNRHLISISNNIYQFDS